MRFSIKVYTFTNKLKTGNQNVGVKYITKVNKIVIILNYTNINVI